MRELEVTFASALAIFVAIACISSLAQMTSVGIDCSQIQALAIDRQANLRAAKVMSECGLSERSIADAYDAETAATEWFAPPGITNVLVSTAKCTSSNNCERNSSVVWASSADGGKTLVDNYIDLSMNGSTGTSYSKDGGAKFVEIQPPPFNTGHGTNYGDPIEIFDANLKMWLAGDLAGGCGGQGVGLWTSSDGVHWNAGACAHNGSNDDHPSMWVDNDPTSGTYGRMYVSFNDFSNNNGALTLVYSDDGNAWSSPVVLSSTTFIRNVQLTGSPVGGRRYEGSNSTVFVLGMDEGGGGLNTRQNLIFKSLDGGSTWSSATMGPRFNPPGATSCQNNYYTVVPPVWRTQGWGQGSVGPKGVVHYAYAGAGTNGDIGDIFYVRSTDNGRTWSKAIKLNTDVDNAYHTQWMPSLTADKKGQVTAAWYDRRAATSACANVGDPGCNYERVGRQSSNNGAKFGSEITISSMTITQATGVACFAGDSTYDTTLNGKVYDAWTDGRRTFDGQHVENVEFAAVEKH